eukprot:g4202.t1
MMLGGLMDVGALMLASQIIVAIVGGAGTILSNLFICTVYLGEELTRKDTFGILLILCAVCLVAVGTPKARVYALKDLSHRFVSKAFVYYVVFCVFLLIVLTLKISYNRFAFASESEIQRFRARSLSRSPRKSRSHSDSHSKSKGKENKNIKNQKSENDKNRSKGYANASSEENDFLEDFDALDENIEAYDSYQHRIHINAMLYAIIAGLLGSFTVLFGKCFSEVIEAYFYQEDFAHLQLEGEKSIQHWQFWVFGISALCCSALQIILINRAIELHDAMNVLPFFQFTWIFFSTIGGIVFYQIPMTRLDYVFCSVSLLLCLWSVSLFSQREPTGYDKMQNGENLDSENVEEGDSGTDSETKLRLRRNRSFHNVFNCFSYDSAKKMKSKRNENGIFRSEMDDEEQNDKVSNASLPLQLKSVPLQKKSNNIKRYGSLEFHSNFRRHLDQSHGL